MKWQCPRPYRARQIGCLNLADDGRCIRREWGNITYNKGESPHAPAKAEAYCERIEAVLREE